MKKYIKNYFYYLIARSLDEQESTLVCPNNFDIFDNSDNVESHSTHTRSGVAEVFLTFAS